VAKPRNNIQRSQLFFQKTEIIKKSILILQAIIYQTNIFIMAGTYSQMHIQLVFAVKNHQSSFIKKEHKDEIEKYLFD